MQNKLNEILELCIEKSKWEDIVFYGFRYCTKNKVITILKNGKIATHGVDIDQALEYMQNE